MSEKEDLVLETMKKAGTPVGPGDIAALTGIPREEVTKIIDKLKKEDKVFSPKRCFYALK